MNVLESWTVVNGNLYGYLNGRFVRLSKIVLWENDIVTTASGHKYKLGVPDEVLFGS